MPEDITLLQIGAPELHQRSEIVKTPLLPEEISLISKLRELLGPKKLIGISAPQIGILKRIFVTQVREPGSQGEIQKFRVFINPEITSYSADTVEMMEGCGSVLSNNLFGPVVRSKQIVVKATDQDGRQFTLKCDGILARVIQHEFDHLEGILFTEKVSDYKKLMSLEHYIDYARKSPNQKAKYAITILEEIT